MTTPGANAAVRLFALMGMIFTGSERSQFSGTIPLQPAVVDGDETRPPLTYALLPPKLPVRTPHGRTRSASRRAVRSSPLRTRANAKNSTPCRVAGGGGGNRSDLRIVPPLELPEASEAVRELRASLLPAVAARLRSGSELVESLARQRRDEILPTTLPAIDALLGGGLSRGKMTEIAGRGARWSVVFAAIAAATAAGEAAALIDLGNHFDPQIAEAAGVDLRRVLWVRPKTLRHAVTAAEMLGATGFQLVVVDAGVPPLRGRRVPDAAWVRLARMCETHGCTLLVSAPFALTGTTSEAMLYAARSRAKWVGGGGAPRLLTGVEVRVTLEKHRRKRPGEAATLFFAVAESCAGSSVPRGSSGSSGLLGSSGSSGFLGSSGSSGFLGSSGLLGSSGSSGFLGSSALLASSRSSTSSVPRANGGRGTEEPEEPEEREGGR